MSDWHKELLQAWADVGQFDGKRGDAELAKAGRAKLSEMVNTIASLRTERTRFTAWVVRGNGHGQRHPETVVVPDRTMRDTRAEITAIGDPKNVEAVLNAIDGATLADDGYDGEALIRIAASRAKRDVVSMQAATKPYRDDLVTRMRAVKDNSQSKEDDEDLSGVVASFQQNLDRTVERLGEVTSMFRERSRDLAEAARKAGPLAARKENR